MDQEEDQAGQLTRHFPPLSTEPMAYRNYSLSSVGLEVEAAGTLRVYSTVTAVEVVVRC